MARGARHAAHGVRPAVRTGGSHAILIFRSVRIMPTILWEGHQLQGVVRELFKALQ